MRIGVVGAGPAGTTVARALAVRSHEVTLFDPSHPRDKPCGGSLGLGVFRKLPRKVQEELPCREVREVEVRSATGRAVTVALVEPLLVSRPAW